MILTLLHLSDLHIKSSANSVLARADEIASACYEAAQTSDLFLIVVTGDVAFSGSREEYAIAIEFLNRIKNAVARESQRNVDIIVVPGNHDCVLSPPDAVRTAVIEKVQLQDSLASDNKVVEACVAAQGGFFDFRKAITSTTPTRDHPLLTEYEFTCQGTAVCISAINAAWMSTIPEIQGNLVFPPELFLSKTSESAVFKVALLHHPLNWYAQKTYHPLRRALRSDFDVVLSGHEHTIASGVTIDSTVGGSTFFEAPALQPTDPNDDAGFVVLLFDFNRWNASEQRFKFDPRQAMSAAERINHDLRPTRHITFGTDLTDEFQKQLDDPGGNFSHPRKGAIKLEDVYVYPDLVEMSGVKQADKEKQISARVLFAGDHSNQRIMLLGDEWAGKSSLLLRSFREYHQRGLFPVYFKASDLTRTDEKGLEELLEKKLSSQYLMPDTFRRTSKEKKIALVDDIDRLRGSADIIARLLSWLEERFTAVVVTAGAGFEIAELVHKQTAIALGTYKSFAVLRFGHRLRRDLIAKWCQQGDAVTRSELEVKIHQVEELLNSVVGRNLVPPRPLFLLILLQSYESQDHSTIQHSGFAHYYHYLITKSLGEAGVTSDRLDELFNYLSHLAWLFKSSDLREASYEQLTGFNKQFSDTFVTVDLDRRLGMLCSSRILFKHGNLYSFTYPYIYYFFVGKYLADHLQEPALRDQVSQWCAALHKRENANAILFLTHHPAASWVIDEITSALRGCFVDAKAINFEKDIESINGLVGSVTQLVISNLDVDGNQRKVRDLRDRLEEEEDREEQKRTDIDQSLDFIDRVHLLLRTAEILGQVLKNYYGSLDRQKKALLIKEVFDGPLRLASEAINELASDPASFVTEIESIIKTNRPKLKAEKRNEVARQVAFRVLGIVATSVVISAAQFVNSEKLMEDIEVAVQNQPTVAYRLIKAAAQLMRPGEVPIDEIRRLATDLEKNAFAFTILQSLGVMHLYLFHTTTSQKDALASHLKLSVTRRQAIEARGPGRRLVK